MGYVISNIPAPPLNEAHMGGFLISWYPLLLTPFNKPPLSLKDQLSLLELRGLIVSDRAAALHYLTHIGYYRICGYAQPLQIGGTEADRHKFKPQVRFEDILELYIFDRKLGVFSLAVGDFTGGITGIYTNYPTEFSSFKLNNRSASTANSIGN
jgi:hypothetical protein